MSKKRKVVKAWAATDRHGRWFWNLDRTKKAVREQWENETGMPFVVDARRGYRIVRVTITEVV